MKKYFYQRIVGALLLGCGATNVASAQVHSDDSRLWSVSDLDSYLSSKGFVETRKRDGILRLAGDVRARWIYAKEDLESVQKPPAKPMLPVNRYRSEFNLYVDYTAANSWMTSKMNWVTIAGGESSAAGLDINRAFLGYRFYKNPETQAEVFAEIGRSGLGDIFDSDVQFNSNFDGIHLYAARRISESLPFTMIVHGGPFVVNMTEKEYAWVVEAVLNKLPGNFVVKTSVIDWNTLTAKTNDPADASATQPAKPDTKYDYLVWQWLVGKSTAVPWFNGQTKNLYTYGAYVFNPLAELPDNWKQPATQITNGKENHAWFVGCTLGGVRRAGDWSLTARYEYVEALAIPEIDVAGIGRGNQMKYWFAQAIKQGLDPKEANGFTNYKGVAYQFVLGLTDSVSFRAYAAYSKPANDQLGSDFTYRKYDLGLISSF
ncbi:hypothetical protein [Chlamydia sp.]|uniref:hypothetical protein n=1 Tax=Chlamydia sp. TaxID=35827 RepID=UPI0025BB7B0B|nr:hypothetical protein [Chlamydia sp.]MBQ8498882.1 hypothetical protein [Chlamydia sp.]